MRPATAGGLEVQGPLGSEVSERHSRSRDRDSERGRGRQRAWRDRRAGAGLHRPCSLIIGRKTILRYRLLFRFFLYLNNVKSSLHTMWIEHKTPTPWRTTLSPGQADLSRWRLRLGVLRAMMVT